MSPPHDAVLARLDEALADAESRLQLLTRECHVGRMLPRPLQPMPSFPRLRLGSRCGSWTGHGTRNEADQPLRRDSVIRDACVAGACGRHRRPHRPRGMAGRAIHHRFSEDAAAQRRTGHRSRPRRGFSPRRTAWPWPSATPSRPRCHAPGSGCSGISRNRWIASTSWSTSMAITARATTSGSVPPTASTMASSPTSPSSIRTGTATGATRSAGMRRRWTVELLIPWHIAPMRDTGTDTRTFAIYLDRVVGATGERVAWPLASFERPRFLSDFAPIEVPRYSQSLLAFTPYVSSVYDAVGQEQRRRRAASTCSGNRTVRRSSPPP